jgi:hypothetical protein
MNYKDAQNFLESWGLSFDTPGGESSTIPYPSVYLRMRDDATKVWGEKFSQFCGRITDTTDGETYLTFDSWTEFYRLCQVVQGGFLK